MTRWMPAQFTDRSGWDNALISDEINSLIGVTNQIKCGSYGRTPLPMFVATEPYRPPRKTQVRTGEISLVGQNIRHLPEQERKRC